MDKKEALDVAIECLEEVMQNYQSDMMEHTLWEGPYPPPINLVNNSKRYFEIQDALGIMVQIRRYEL